MIEITAEIRNIRYHPTLCRPLPEYELSELDAALSRHASFFVTIDSTNKIAISRWVSPKRTRTYPYGRVYDTLQYSGKKVTVIPIFKDEGFYGDRDFLQWDTVSLMNLLGVYTIIGYYDRAQPNFRHPEKPKITKQRFNIEHIYDNLRQLLRYQSDALHWNLDQLNQVGHLGELALAANLALSQKYHIPMHSYTTALQKIETLKKDADTFKQESRKIAASAASRETNVINPHEKIAGTKGRITITNYLGGEYHLTVDEVWFIDNDTLLLVEAKHTTDPHQLITSANDIKDALVKMILFTNLENIRIMNRMYQHRAIMKLTASNQFSPDLLAPSKRRLYQALQEEARINGFQIIHQ